MLLITGSLDHFFEYFGNLRIPATCNLQTYAGFWYSVEVTHLWQSRRARKRLEVCYVMVDV